MEGKSGTSPLGLLRQVREFWDRRPCNIRYSSKPVGSREYFEEVEARRYVVGPHIPRFAQFERWKGKRVLEIGCGIGTDSINFARAGAEVTVVELSEESLRLCHKGFAVFGLRGSFYLGNAEFLTSFVPIEPYDLIYSCGAIHHTVSPYKVLAEVKRYCKLGTEIRVMLYSKWSWKVFWIILRYGKGAFWQVDKLVRAHSEAQPGCPVTYFYSLKDVRRLMADFEVISISKDHIFPYVIKDYLNYIYKKVWYFRFMPRVLFRMLERRLGSHTLIVARLKR